MPGVGIDPQIALIIAAALRHGAERLGILAVQVDGGLDPVLRGTRSAMREAARWARGAASSITERAEAVMEPDRRQVTIVGDLFAAEHIAVLVPGMGARRAHATTRQRAARLQQSAHRARPGATTAVVAWTAYDAPDPWSLAVVTDRAARRGSVDLARFLEFLPDAHLTVIGHSYGSVVAGELTPGRSPFGGQLDDVVLLGSPGIPSAPHPGAGPRRWAAAAPLDPVTWLDWFGRDPADPTQGAVVLPPPPAGLSAAHGSYFEGATLERLGLIIAGRPAAIDAASAGPVDRALSRAQDQADRWRLDVGLPYGLGKTPDLADAIVDLARGLAGRMRR